MIPDTTIYLRAATRAHLAAALPFAWSERGGWVAYTHQWALDRIGPLLIEPGVYDPETGDETAPPVFDTRYHANIRCTAELAAQIPAEIIVSPEEPRRDFA